MNLEYLHKCLDDQMSIRDIAKDSGKSYTTIRYWLKKYNLSTKHVSIQEHKKSPYKCSFCGETNPDKFYGNKRTRCAGCHNKDVIKKGRENKRWAVNLMGGACSACGYDKSLWALQFHHLDPEVKDKGFGSMQGWSRERISKELEKCVLLCANCHAEEHERIAGDFNI